MYLSRLILNPKNGRVRRDLANCHDLHRTILKALPQLQPGATHKARESYGVLHRLEWDGKSGSLRVYVQSLCQPNWSLLPNGYLLPGADSGDIAACKPVGHIYENLAEGTVLCFSLKANPTRTIGTTLKSERLAGTPRNNGRRVFIADSDSQIDWLRRKAAIGGFELLSVRINPQVPDVDALPLARTLGTCPLNDGKVSAKLSFGAVLFHGHLRVTNRERFLDTLAKGVGSGKAYGFGLLSIGPSR